MRRACVWVRGTLEDRLLWVFSSLLLVASLSTASVASDDGGPSYRTNKTLHSKVVSSVGAANESVDAAADERTDEIATAATRFSDEPDFPPATEARLASGDILSRRTESNAGELQGARRVGVGGGNPSRGGRPGIDPNRPLLLQLFRKTGGRATWLLSDGEEGLDTQEFELSSTLFIPPIIGGGPILVTPRARLTVIDDIPTLGTPNHLYRLSTSLVWMKKLNERWGMRLGFTPGVSSDLHATTDAFRLFAYAAARYQASPTYAWTFGAAVTGREDIPVLPMIGLTLTPNPDTRIEITAPRPQFSRRVYPPGSLAWGDPVANEHWIYTALELGGNTWAVERPGVGDDLLTIRDFRLIGGMEIRSQGRMNALFEAGYVFGRSVEFESDEAGFDPSDAFMLRVGLTF